MIEEPEAHASDTSQKPNSSLDHSTISAPRRDRCVAQVAAARQEVEHEVAVGDRVDRVRRHARRSPARARAATGRCRSSRRPARPRRAAGRWSTRSTNSKRRASRAEHPEVREQVMRRDRPAGRAAGACSRASASRGGARRAATSTLCRPLQRLERPQGVRAREHRHVGGDLVVARARGVQLAADRADDLRQPALDRHVDVLVVVVEAERRRPRARAATRSSPFSSASRSASLMIPDAASIVAWARDCSTS